MRNITYGLVKKHKRFNIYLVRSPFQLVSAIEAKNHFSGRGSILIVGPIFYRDGYSSFEKVLEFERFDKVIFIKNELSLFEGLNILFTIKIIYLYRGKIEYLFNGFPGYHIFEWIIRSVPSEKIFEIDDGTKNLSSDSISNADQRGDSNSGMVKTIKKHMKKLIFFDTKVNNYTYGIFTCFEKKDGMAGELIKHNFDYIRSRISDMNIEKNTVYFYGSPLSEERIVKLSDELYLIKMVKNIYKIGYSFFYIPHPRESAKKLEEINNEGIPIKHLNYPAEIDPIISETIPEIIVSFFSTILISMSKIYEHNNIISYEINPSFLMDRKEKVLKIYKNFKKIENISVVRI